MNSNNVDIQALDDISMNMEQAVNKMEVIQQAITDDYFRKYSTYKNENDKLAILHEHDHYEQYANIVSDYIQGLKSDIQKLQQKLNG